MRNLLMLMADDERFDETSRPLFNGSLMRAMPQSLVCAPARMSLLTGQRPHILGPDLDNGEDGFERADHRGQRAHAVEMVDDVHDVDAVTGQPVADQ